jgi:hypothetical protein
MKYNNTHNITTTIQKITTIQKPNQQQLPQDHLRLAKIQTRKIIILPNSTQTTSQYSDRWASCSLLCVSFSDSRLRNADS